MSKDEHGYRAGLPPFPASLRVRPIERGYPVPWFVAKVKGVYDFRIADPRRMNHAVQQRLCWICGQRLGREMTFAIGPMCAVNRTSSEPPSHYECALFAARACPFLIQKEAERRSTGLPENVHKPAGEMIMRQPGVLLLWRTDSYKIFSDGRGGALFDIGTATATEWFREGREATREEIEYSIDTGVPELMKACRSFGEMAQLREAVAHVKATLLPEAIQA